MAKENRNIILEGEIIELLPNTMYKVRLNDDREVWAVPAGRVRRSFVRIMPGDTVKVEFTPYDDSRGRVVAKINKKRRGTE
jgi:translation initiation factor IF-1